MKRLLYGAGAFLCAALLPLAAFAQLTTVTASSLKMGGSAITTGRVYFTPVSTIGNPIPFADGTGALNDPTAYACAITSGAIGGMVQGDGVTISGTCQVPDSALTNPANILYQIQVIDTSTGRTTSGKSFTLQAVIGLTGTTWALDHYGPPAQTTNIQSVQAIQGATTPTSCVGPAVFTNTATTTFYTCIGGVYVAVTGQAGSVTYGTTSCTAAQGNDARIVGAVQRAGDTMTGPLVLPADPTTALQASTKQYVDAHSGGSTTNASLLTSGTLAAARLPALTGDVTMASGSGVTLLATLITPGTCGDSTHVGQITYDAKGRITVCSPVAISASSGITSLTGDVTAAGPGAAAATLAAVNSSPGSFGSTTQTPVITVDAKGRITAVSSATIAGGGGSSAPAFPSGIRALYQLNDQGAGGGTTFTDTSGNGNTFTGTGSYTWTATGLSKGHTTGCFNIPPGIANGAKGITIFYDHQVGADLAVGQGTDYYALAGTNLNNFFWPFLTSQYGASPVWFTGGTALSGINNKAIGPTSTTLTFGASTTTPETFYANGNTPFGYTIQSPTGHLTAMAVDGTVGLTIGAYLSNCSGGMSGTIYAVALWDVTAPTPAQVAALEAAEEYQLSTTRNVHIGERDVNRSGAQLVDEGDSITLASGTGVTFALLKSYHYVSAQLSGMPFTPWSTAIGGETLQTMATNVYSHIGSIFARYGGGGVFGVTIMAGTNDLPANRTLVNMQTDINTIITSVHSYGAKIAVSTITPRGAGGNNTITGPQETIRQGYNAYVRALRTVGVVNFTGTTVSGNAVITLATGVSSSSFTAGEAITGAGLTTAGSIVTALGSGTISVSPSPTASATVALIGHGIESGFDSDAAPGLANSAGVNYQTDNLHPSPTGYPIIGQLHAAAVHEMLDPSSDFTFTIPITAAEFAFSGAAATTQTLSTGHTLGLKQTVCHVNQQVVTPWTGTGWTAPLMVSVDDSTNTGSTSGTPVYDPPYSWAVAGIEPGSSPAGSFSTGGTINLKIVTTGGNINLAQTGVTNLNITLCGESIR